MEIELVGVKDSLLFRFLQEGKNSFSVGSMGNVQGLILSHRDRKIGLGFAVLGDHVIPGQGI